MLDSYLNSSQSYPTVFTTASGCQLNDSDGRTYLDFVAGEGGLNYGHNNPVLKQALLKYLSENGVVQNSHLATQAQAAFGNAIQEHILKPRNLKYEVARVHADGAHAMDAALDVARHATGRSHVIAFTNASSKTLQSSMSASSDTSRVQNAARDVMHMPYDGYLGDDIETLDLTEKYLADASSGVDAPAAFVVETVQGEGLAGASSCWLWRLQGLAKKYQALLIVDDTHVGCGRTGTFFSFEQVGLRPDIVCLASSLSGYGLPLGSILYKAELDQWKPEERRAISQGNELALVTAGAALEEFWSTGTFSEKVQRLADRMTARMERLATCTGCQLRGRGLIQGVAFDDPTLATRAKDEAFARGVLVGTSGANEEVLRLLPPLTITEEELDKGLDAVEEAVAKASAGGERAIREPLRTVSNGLYTERTAI